MGNVFNYVAMCSYVVVVLFFVDFYMLINHVLEKNNVTIALSLLKKIDPYLAKTWLLIITPS